IQNPRQRRDRRVPLSLSRKRVCSLWSGEDLGLERRLCLTNTRCRQDAKASDGEVAYPLCKQGVRHSWCPRQVLTACLVEWQAASSTEWTPQGVRAERPPHGRYR